MGVARSREVGRGKCHPTVDEEFSLLLELKSELEAATARVNALEVEDDLEKAK